MWQDRQLQDGGPCWQRETRAVSSGPSSILVLRRPSWPGRLSKWRGDQEKPGRFSKQASGVQTASTGGILVFRGCCAEQTGSLGAGQRHCCVWPAGLVALLGRREGRGCLRRVRADHGPLFRLTARDRASGKKKARDAPGTAGGVNETPGRRRGASNGVAAAPGRRSGAAAHAGPQGRRRGPTWLGSRDPVCRSWPVPRVMCRRQHSMPRGGFRSGRGRGRPVRDR
jgi:hypothetical protein